MLQCCRNPQLHQASYSDSVLYHRWSPVHQKVREEAQGENGGGGTRAHGNAAPGEKDQETSCGSEGHEQFPPGIIRLVISDDDQ